MENSQLEWFKSSLSAAGNCVEAAPLPDGGMAVRNSREPHRMIRFTAGEWDAFVGGAKNGEFDRPAG